MKDKIIKSAIKDIFGANFNVYLKTSKDTVNNKVNVDFNYATTQSFPDKIDDFCNLLKKLSLTFTKNPSYISINL